MTIAAFRKGFLSALCMAPMLVAPAAFAQAESASGLSGAAPVVRGDPGRQLWRIADYTTIELTPREPGAPDNQHPWTIAPNPLYALLQQVQLAQATRDGLPKPLFAIDELNRIVPALVEALANARADQDIALVSAARHEDNTFYGVTAVTARLFVVDGHLNLIVHDARVDFYDAARASGMAPHFTVGSRATESQSPVRSPGATNKRSDWLVLPAVPALPSAPVVAAPVWPVLPLAPATPIPPAEPADAEHRLIQLKRLRDKGLITKSEYESKRAQIIKSL